MAKPAKVVTYVEDGDHDAIAVSGDVDGHGALKLLVVPDSGAPYQKFNVPYRGPNSPDGNNVTWH